MTLHVTVLMLFVDDFSVEGAQCDSPRCADSLRGIQTGQQDARMAGLLYHVSNGTYSYSMSYDIHRYEMY